jgi:hypothetical protein
MDALPQELIDMIILNLDVRQQPLIKRFAVVTPATQTDIVAGRVVERRWRDSKVLRALFPQDLDETPFIWQDHHLPSLGTIGAMK